MANDLPPLVQRVEADISNFESELKRAGRITEDFGAKSAKSAEQATGRLEGSLRGAGEELKATTAGMRQGESAARGYGAAVGDAGQAFDRSRKSVGGISDSFKEATKHGQLANHQLSNIRSQLVDIAVGFQGGQSPLTIAFQQLPQLAGAFGPGASLRTVVSGLTEGVVGLVRPLGLVGGGFAAVAAAALTAGGAYLSFDSAQKSIAVGLNGLGKQSGIARDQIEALARGSDLATTDARKLATAFAATGNATSESIAGALARSRDFAVTFSTDIEGAGKVQEEFFSNASAAYDKYAGRLGVFSAATSRQIKDLQQVGNGAGATKLAFDEVNRGLTTYNENAGLVRTATDKISEGFSNLYSGLGRGVAVLGGDSRALGSAAAIAAAERAGEIARAQADAERANTVIIERARTNKTLQLNPVEREVKQNIEQAGLGDANKYKTVEERFAGVFSDASRASIGSFDKYPTTYGNAEERMRRAMTATPEEQKATVRRLTEDTNNIAQNRALNDTSEQATRIQKAQAEALGKTTGETERLTTRAGLLNRATADGIPLAESNRKRIDEIADALGRQAQAYAEAALKRDILFQREQLGRTPAEASIAASLRLVYGDNLDSPAAKAAAEQLRLTDSIRQTQVAYSALGQMGSTLIDPLLDSTRSWSDAFSGLARNIARAALQATLLGQGPFAGAFGTQGAGAGPGGIFGSLLSGAGLLGGAKSSGALQGPTQSGATLDAVAGGGIISTIGAAIKGLFGFARGGSITGPGTGTSDSILARVSKDEFIVRADRARQHRGLLEAINGPGLPGFVTGGLVGAASPTPEFGEEFMCDVRIAA